MLSAEQKFSLPLHTRDKPQKKFIKKDNCIFLKRNLFIEKRE
jgi:hypothetical protein